MNIFLFDAFCAVLIVGGSVIAFSKRARPPEAGDGAANNDPGMYARRIAGVMVMALGLALATIFTAFHYA